jgi:hypothetical protein
LVTATRILLQIQKSKSAPYAFLQNATWLSFAVCLLQPLSLLELLFGQHNPSEFKGGLYSAMLAMGNPNSCDDPVDRMLTSAMTLVVVVKGEVHHETQQVDTDEPNMAPTVVVEGGEQAKVSMQDQDAIKGMEQIFHEYMKLSCDECQDSTDAKERSLQGLRLACRHRQIMIT